jgi:hypothetical protein
MTRVTGLRIAAVLSAWLGVAALPGAAAAPDAAIRAFTLRVRAYVELRHEVAKHVPPIPISSDWVAIEAASDRLALAIRMARGDAKVGAIFTPDIGAAFRQRIGAALTPQTPGAGDLPPSATRDPPPAPPICAVNARFDWSLGAMMPVRILAALPPLPGVLQYRIVDRDLVLLDIDARLVIDVLAQALPAY